MISRLHQFSSDHTNLYLTLHFFFILDVTNLRQRIKPTNEGKCSSISRFVFDWEIDPSTHTEGISLTSALFRPYMQVTARHFQVEGPVKVDFSVTLRQFGHSSVNSTHYSIGHLKSLNVTTESDGWMELDITDALKEIWPPRENTPYVEVILKMQVNCQDQKKVPVKFINPAEIPLSQTMRRERYLELQPLFVISVDNDQVKSRIKDEKQQQFNGSPIKNRRKRYARSTTELETCRIENFTINFSDLKLDHIVEPKQINIQRCNGACAHNNIELNKTIATNHAKLMASARERYQQLNSDLPTNNTLYISEPRVPCCVPTSYESVYLMLQHPNGFQLELFSDFVVTECGCR